MKQTNLVLGVCTAFAMVPSAWAETRGCGSLSEFEGGWTNYDGQVLKVTQKNNCHVVLSDVQNGIDYDFKLDGQWTPLPSGFAEIQKVKRNRDFVEGGEYTAYINGAGRISIRYRLRLAVPMLARTSLLAEGALEIYPWGSFRSSKDIVYGFRTRIRNVEITKAYRNGKEAPSLQMLADGANTVLGYFNVPKNFKYVVDAELRRLY